MILTYLILLLLPCITQQAYAEFSLKGITSWITGTQEATFFQEYPLTNGTLFIENDTGSITIKSWSLPKVAIEALKKASEKNLNSVEIETMQVNNQVSVRTLNTVNNGTVHYQLMVPVNTHIIVKAQNCTVKTKNLSGTQQISTLGAIDIQGATNNVHAITSGAINAEFLSLPLQGSVSLKSLKSSVSLILPPKTNAHLKAVTLYNTIISQHVITLNPITMLLNKKSWDRCKKEINGIIGKGGASLDISASSGIHIN